MIAACTTLQQAAPRSFSDRTCSETESWYTLIHRKSPECADSCPCKFMIYIYICILYIYMYIYLFIYMYVYIYIVKSQCFFTRHPSDSFIGCTRHWLLTTIGQGCHTVNHSIFCSLTTMPLYHLLLAWSPAFWECCIPKKIKLYTGT